MNTGLPPTYTPTPEAIITSNKCPRRDTRKTSLYGHNIFNFFKWEKSFLPLSHYLFVSISMWRLQFLYVRFSSINFCPSIAHLLGKYSKLPRNN